MVIVCSISVRIMSRVFYLETAPVSKWNGGSAGTSESFNSFRSNSNNDENSNPNSGGSFGARNAGGSCVGIHFFNLKGIFSLARNEQGGFTGGGSGAFRTGNDGNSRGKVRPG